MNTTGICDSSRPDGARRRPYREVLLTTLHHAHAADYRGYSKYDGLLGRTTQALSLGWWPLRLAWSQVVMRAPLNLRPWLGIGKSVNPEALALFAQANLACVEMGFSGPFAGRAEHCLDRLLAHDTEADGDYHGRGWGYQHPWQTTGFYQPPHSPNCYVTALVGEALLQGHHVLARPDYLKAARSAADFVLRDLQVFHEDAETKCIAYVPRMRSLLQVININALAGAFLGHVGTLTGEGALLVQARKLLTFVARQQTPDGAWYYTTSPRQSLVAHDNYHTGMILDALWRYEHVANDGLYHQTYARGLDYYRQHLFLPNGAPRWTNTRTWPHDVHGAAQGILTFALAGEPGVARQIAAWALEHLYKGNGDFMYQEGRFLSKRFTLLHWCNGWMARGLAALVLADHRPARQGL